MFSNAPFDQMQRVGIEVSNLLRICLTLSENSIKIVSNLRTFKKIQNPVQKSKIVPSGVDASIAPCVYSWPWVAVKLSSQLSIHNVDSGLIIKFESGMFFFLI